MRERLFRKKTPEEGTGWTVNNKAGWIVTSFSIVILLLVTMMIDQAIEDRITSTIVSVTIVALWAVAFTLFAKWESERS